MSKEIAITHDGKAVVTETMSLGGGAARLYFGLGTCGTICGKPGHEDNEKPHVRNDSCWNWKQSEYVHLGEVRDLKITYKPTTEDLL